MSHAVVVRGSHMRRFTSLFAIASLATAPSLLAQGGTASTTDPRVGLKAGLTNAGEASKNMVLISHSAKAESLSSTNLGGLTFANSDLAFRGNYVFQGNFSGFQIWDISNPAKPVLKKTDLCATGQGDPSIYGNLLFISAEGPGNRIDCGTQGVQDTVSTERFRGVRIFDITDIAHPKQVAAVQNCRGSHTHTLVEDPKDKSVIYVYISGSQGSRSPTELAGCFNTPIDSANSANFRIDIIRVPLAHPEQAKVVGEGRIFAGLQRRGAHGPAPEDPPAGGRGGRGGRGGGGGAGAVDSAGRGRAAGDVPVTIVNGVVVTDSAAGRGGRGGRGGGRGGRGGPGVGPDPNLVNQCHDITVYPAIGLAGGACGGFGLLLDIRDPVNPIRIDFAGDTNFAFWHSATFSNDGSKLIFTDEWGGGTAPKCRATDPLDWGGDAIFTIKNRNLQQHAYFKMPAAQTSQENCVAHNGSLVPIPGRDIMVQGWYQGGVDVFDFTDVNHPVEIAYFDRGPIDSTRLYTGGFWAGYWYNGHIIGSEIARGLDIFELTASDQLSQNEIDAAKSVRWTQFNPQDQPKITWPATFSLPRAYLDQLERNNGLASDKIAQVRKDLDAAEKMPVSTRQAALSKLAAGLEPDAAKAADAARVKWVVAAIRDLSKVAR
jgi:hypothetical protein